jgi:hypothetical protein
MAAVLFVGAPFVAACSLLCVAKATSLSPRSRLTRAVLLLCLRCFLIQYEQAVLRLFEALGAGHALLKQFAVVDVSAWLVTVFDA